MYLKKAYISVGIFFILVALALIVASNLYKNYEIEVVLNNHLNTNETYVQQEYHNYKLLAGFVREHIINDSVTIDIFKDAYNATEEERNIIRENLKNHLNKHYIDLQKIGFKQLHFHLPDNSSFLRMHSPSKFGDDLTSARYSIKKVNKTLQTVDGFEEGRVVSGFRFVFPVIDNKNNHIGSVEASVSANGFIKRIENIIESDVHFIIKKSVVDLKVWEDSKSKNYTVSDESSNYYLEKHHDIHRTVLHSDKKMLKKLSNVIEKNMQTNEKFVLNTGDSQVVSFIPIKNIEDNKVVAYFVIYENDTAVKYANLIFILLNAAIIFLFVLSLYLTIKEVLYRKKIIDSNERLSSKIKLEVIKNRKHDKQLLQQSQMAQMGEMISMIAHQWRQPLAAIAAKTIDLEAKIELEQFDLEKEEGRQQCNAYFTEEFKNINKYVMNLTNTIDDFRNFYKPNKKSTSILINTPIEKSIDIIKPTIELEGIKIIEEYNSTKKISLYNNEMMQVFLNILKNAQDNFKEKKIENPKIHIVTKDTDDGVLVNIIDNGGGIPNDILPKIFEPYFSSKYEKNGTGLGLYMSKIIIEDHHNGNLEASNIDNGACFTIKIKSKVNI